ncbi:trypsin-like peptidase domain-containing protein [Paludisphaera sp.]|uniref:trypsin-like peptidase domain-containing protein n=1 Tax=Paludisphaera sp. TaxID=2017432 RepID=UPI00301D7D68
MSFLLCLACAATAWQDGPRAEAPAAPAAMDVVVAFEEALTGAIARTEGSVVAIHRDKSENAGETLAVRGKPRPRRVIGDEGRPSRPADDVAISFDFGAGVVIGDDGEILTAFHVVRGATRLIVRAAGRQEFDAEVIAADPRSDLAVIVPVAGPGLEPPDLKPMPIGDSSTLRKGSFLIALGNPFNSAMQDGRAAATWGILSNVARRVVYDPEVWPVLGNDPRARQLPHQPMLLQLDSKLNLGMSGGAVVNLKGELVGLTTTAASPAGYDAMAGYAFPMDPAGRRAVETLKQGKEVEYGLIGITQTDSRGELDARPPNRIDGVAPNSPAAQGELQVGDLFLAVDGTPARDFSELLVAVSSHAPGDKIRLKVLREGRELERTLTIAKYPVKGEVIATARPAAWRGLRVDHRSLLSVGVVPFGPAAPEPQGVAVREVEPGSPADKAGLRPWMTIQEAAGRAVDVPADFAKAVADQKGPVRLMTDRGPITVGP